MPSSNQFGGAGGSGSRGPRGSGPQPDLEEFLRRSQDKLRSALQGNLGGRGMALIALAAIALWGFSGFFRVEPDELGVVLRFGKFTREVQPGSTITCPIRSRPRSRRRRCASTRWTSACASSKTGVAARRYATCRRKA